MSVVKDFILNFAAFLSLGISMFFTMLLNLLTLNMVIESVFVLDYLFISCSYGCVVSSHNSNYF